MAEPLFIDLEEAIIGRLETKLATLSPLPRVYPAADLANAQDKSQSAQAVYVAYNGIVGVESLPNNPHVAKITVEYLLWIVTRSASRHGSQQGTRENADPIVAGVIEALMGWRASPQTPPLEMSEAPGQVYVDGFGYFPLAFRCVRTVRGNPT